MVSESAFDIKLKVPITVIGNSRIIDKTSELAEGIFSSK